MGIVGKKLLWHTLPTVKLQQLNGYDFEELERRAGQQIERIEAACIREVQQVFPESNSSQ